MPVQVMRFSIDDLRAQLALVPLFWLHRNRCSLSMQLYVVPFIKFCVGIVLAETICILFFTWMQHTALRLRRFDKFRNFEQKTSQMPNLLYFIFRSIALDWFIAFEFLIYILIFYNWFVVVINTHRNWMGNENSRNFRGAACRKDTLSRVKHTAERLLCARYVLSADVMSYTLAHTQHGSCVCVPSVNIVQCVRLRATTQAKRETEFTDVCVRVAVQSVCVTDLYNTNVRTYI